MSYHVRPVTSPRLAGAKLRLAVGLLEGRVSGALLAKGLLRDTGIEEFRAYGLTEACSVAPPLPRVGSIDPGPAGRAGSAAALDALCREASADGRPGEAGPGVLDYAKAYRDGTSDPEQVAEKVLAASEDAAGRDPAMGLFIAQDGEDVRRQAVESADRHRLGEALGVFDGVPVAVKDELDQSGYPTTVGTRFLGAEPATADAEVVARLRAAGAVLIGKTNMHEIGIGVTGLNPHYGPARNPCDPSRATGGSSSGSAAAVAAGLCPVAVGADGGGSIRIPSSLCGVVGLKPTFGRVSETGAAPLCWSVAHVGPIGATARDVALAYAVMAGPDSRDPNTLGQPSPRFDGFGGEALAGLRVGVYRPWFEDADPSVVQHCASALERLEASGAVVVDVEIPELELLRVAHLVTIVSEMFSALQAFYGSQRGRYGHDVRLSLALGKRLTAADYVHAQRARTRVCGHFRALLGGWGGDGPVDVIATPGTGCVAPPLRSDALRTGDADMPLLDRIMRFAPAANLTGLPAIVFPVGYDEGQLPVALQLIGAPWDEHRLLAIAQAAEPLFSRRRPTVRYELL